MPLLFSYGTLQLEDVQRSTFGRVLQGEPDALVGFQSGRHGKYANVVFNGDEKSRVSGVVFEITDAELAAADHYENDTDATYQRIETTLASGKRAWVYVAPNS
jgi:gamma-glutamylcyclotransferase (GGCT)/AIG2-like uncharacterized protein YtfP